MTTAITGWADAGRRSALKRTILGQASATAALIVAGLAGLQGAYAQVDTQATDQTTPPTAAADQAPASQNQNSGLAEIVVSGTRIVRNGYEAPTPVSVLSMEDLSAMAQPNIADAINRMPEVSGSTRPTNSYADDITLGINNINLRALGPDRTLVLLDGQRLVASTIEGFNS